MSMDPYECAFCHATFVVEGKYMKHYCDKQLRVDTMKTITGQNMYSYYSKWMISYHRIVPKHESFLSSKYYMAFSRFNEFVNRVNIPDVDMFITLMREKEICPTIWANDQVYSIYLEHIDRRATPSEQAKITIQTLFKVAEAADCDTSEVFDVLTPNDVIQFLRTRQLSPWLLLLSPKFKHFLVNKTTPEQRIVLEAIIRPHYWKAKFEKNAGDVLTIKKYITALNL